MQNHVPAGPGPQAVAPLPVHALVNVGLPVPPELASFRPLVWLDGPSVSSLGNATRNAISFLDCCAGAAAALFKADPEFVSAVGRLSAAVASPVSLEQGEHSRMRRHPTTTFCGRCTPPALRHPWRERCTNFRPAAVDHFADISLCCLMQLSTQWCQPS